MRLTGFNLLIWFSVQILPMHCNSLPVGFSYTKFSGPVSGPEQQVLIYDDNNSGYPYVDYVAQPDYQFSYGIDDPKSGVQQSRKEIRRGDTLYGEYSVVQPDGTVRMVRYTADDVNGYQADVTIDGQPISYQNNQNIRVIPVHEHDRIPEPTKVPEDDDQQSVVKVSPSQEPNTSEDEENGSADSEGYSGEKNNEYRSYTSEESFESSESDEDSY